MVWTNYTDVPHTATSQATFFGQPGNEFDTRDIFPGTSNTLHMSAETPDGNYAYLCRYHYEHDGWTAVIQVRA